MTRVRTAMAGAGAVGAAADREAGAEDGVDMVEAAAVGAVAEEADVTAVTVVVTAAVAATGNFTRTNNRD